MNTQLLELFEQWAGEKADSITPLPQSGSYRKYFRIISNKKNAIGVYNSDKKENDAFISFTKHFLNKNLLVPQLYADDMNNDVYLLEDLGNETLFSFISEEKNKEDFPDKRMNYYKSVLSKLIKFQTDASRDLDYSVCYPRNSFDRQSMMWDLNYFKYYFLKLTQTPFDEQKLEDDFNALIEFLLTAKKEYFMYRDFQSRNVMIKNDKLYFIDYQGGRKGALQYDVASLLYDAKANLPPAVRDELLAHYLSVLCNETNIEKDEFMKYYNGYVLIRILQAMGAYGFRGLYEKKAHFLKSIPYAINNIWHLLENDLLPKGLKELKLSLAHLTRNKSFKVLFANDDLDKLIVSINSFSYKSGIPVDLSGNGGGFVFDCRILLNPGRNEEFKNLTGKDKKVIKFLEDQNDVKEFLTNTISIVESAVKNYTKRNFNHLMINFGCTGGQHRSVYCVERLAEFLNRSFDITVVVKHIEMEKKGMLK